MNDTDLDISHTLSAKSDQLNAVDLIAGPRIIRITSVKAGSSEQQPISVSYEGDNGKPWKPCKSMRRALAAAWGTKAGQWPGRRVKLVLDPSVIYAGEKVGGIRIEALSHIKARLSIPLQLSKAVRKVISFEPLPDEDSPTHEQLIEWLGDQAPAALAFLIGAGRLSEGQTLADLPEANRAKIYRSQAFLDAAGITLTSSTN